MANNSNFLVPEVLINAQAKAVESVTQYQVRAVSTNNKERYSAECDSLPQRNQSAGVVESHLALWRKHLET
ncbi:hypothetical protein J6590_043650 [Homalodisca vitripennis]|nr:hypothetical protein J6590_043650 [Homalodisca vitripennis]